jgi:hypothetical protein
MTSRHELARPMHHYRNLVDRYRIKEDMQWIP